MKKRLYIAAANNRYGQNVFLPYAAGLMWAYARQFPEITDAYELGHGPGTGLLFLKEPVERAADRLESPDVLALSSYIWNHQWNKALAREVKRRWPNCTILVGGVQVPDASPRILEENPEFDFAIYGEGEGAFADFLKALDRWDTAEWGWEQSFDSVGSLVWWRDKFKIIVNPRRAEVPIEDIPSPYLEGLFDDLVQLPFKFQALQESNRGCPYQCSFCAWGVSSLSKVRQFPTDRIVAEYEWMAAHKVEFLYNCDANYGLLKRDIDLTESLVKTKADRGYPKRFRAAFAKNSNDVVFQISKTLSDADMLKATTLALQSMKEETLGLIKRKNIRYERLAELSARYEAEGIATYAEIIVGLPGETLQSFIEGLDTLLDAGQHDSVTIYLCMILDNTEMAHPEYRRAHGIESVPMRALLYHGTPEPDVVEEVQETVVATAAMPSADLERAVLYGWLLQALHSFGLTQVIARRLRERGTRYSALYLALLDRALERPETLLGREVARSREVFRAAARGEPWDTVDPRFGDVMWPPEELLFLRLACDSERFYGELPELVGGERDLVENQRRVFIPPEPGREREYAREAVWFGRKGPGRRLRIRGG